MSNYPLWWDTTLTIFNKCEDPTTNLITWYKTVVHNCFWKYTGDKVAVGNTILETNNTICRIPQDARFLEKYEWLAKSNLDKPNYFTLGVGDLIIRGEVDDVIDEYSAGHRSTDIIKKYKALQGVIQIERESLNVGVGRNNPHYYIRGI